MNKHRRNKLEMISEQLQQLMGELDAVKTAEEEAYDNLPEGLQESERGERMQEAIDNLDAASGSLEEALDSITEARNN